MRKDKRQKGKPENASIGQSAGNGSPAPNETAAANTDKDMTIEHLTQKHPKVHEELVQNMAKLSKEKEILQQMAERRMVAQTLLNENASNINRIFTLDSNGDYYKYTKNKQCCLDTASATPCAARNKTAHISCRHEICSRATTQGITCAEFGTIRYYEMRIYVEKTERKKIVLQKQREFELVRLKKIEDEANAAKARKAVILHKGNRGLRIEKAPVSQIIDKLPPHPTMGANSEGDLHAALFAARLEMMQTSKQIAILAGSKQNREDFGKIQGEVSSVQLLTQEGSVGNAKLLENLEQATFRLKDYERREKLFDVALRELGLSPTGEEASTTAAAMTTDKPPSTLIESLIKKPKSEFSTSIEQAHATITASLGALGATASNAQRKVFAEQEKTVILSRHYSGETGKRVDTDDITTVIVKLRQKLQVAGHKHIGYKPTLGTKHFYEQSLRVEVAALRDIEKEYQRLANASLEVMTISLKSIKAAAIVKSSIPLLTNLILDVVVSTWLDLHRARYILQRLNELSDKELDGQLISAVLARAEKRPEWYMDSISLVTLAFEAATFEPPDQIYLALARVKLRVMERLKKISGTTTISSPASETPKRASKSQDDLKIRASNNGGTAIVATGDANLQNRPLNNSPEEQIDAIKRLILYHPFASQDLPTYTASLYHCGYSPGCSLIEIVHVLVELADRRSRRLNEEMENLAIGFVEPNAHLLRELEMDQEAWPVWHRTLQELVVAFFEVTMTITMYLKDLFTQKRLPTVVLHTACNIMSALVLSPVLEQLEGNLKAFQIFAGGEFDSGAVFSDVLTCKLLEMAKDSRFLCQINLGYCRYHREIADQTVPTISEDDDLQHGVPTTIPVKKELSNLISQGISTTTRMHSYIVSGPLRRKFPPRDEKASFRHMRQMDKELIMKELAELSAGSSERNELSIAIGEKVLRLGKLHREAYRQAGEAIPREFERGIAYAERAITRRNEEYKTSLSAKWTGDDRETAKKTSRFAEDFSEAVLNIQGHYLTRHKIHIMEHETIKRLEGIGDGTASAEFCCWVAYNVKLQAESALEPSQPFRTFTNILSDFGPIPKILSLALDVVKVKRPCRAEYLVQYPQSQWKSIIHIMKIMEKIEANEISFCPENDESWRATPLKQPKSPAYRSQKHTPIEAHHALNELSSELDALEDCVHSSAKPLDNESKHVYECFSMLTATMKKMAIIGEADMARKLLARLEATIMGTGKQLADANLVAEPLVVLKGGLRTEELKYCDYLARLPAFFRKSHSVPTITASKCFSSVDTDEADLKRRNEFQGFLEAFMSNVAELSDAFGYLAQQERRWLQPLQEVVEAVHFMSWNTLHIARTMVLANGWRNIAQEIDETLLGDGIVDEELAWSTAGNAGDSDQDTF